MIRGSNTSARARFGPSNTELPFLLADDPWPQKRSQNSRGDMVTGRMVAYALRPSMADGYRSERLLHNPLQAQRDYFGAHTYERFDEEGTSAPSGFDCVAGPRWSRADGSRCTVQRFDGNPILTCHDVNVVWKSPDLQVRRFTTRGSPSTAARA